MEHRETVRDWLAGRICRNCNRMFAPGQQIIVTRDENRRFLSAVHDGCGPSAQFVNRKSAEPKKDFQEWD
jgi:RNase P subunit RPR2